MMKKFSKTILISLLVLSGIILCNRPILTGAGMFLAPTSKESADVLILEGTQIAKRSALKTGITLLSNGRANRMVVVLHSPLREGEVFTLPEEYPQFLIDELVRLGLKKEKIEIIPAPIPGHPITLSEARFIPGEVLPCINKKETNWVSTSFLTLILPNIKTIPGGAISRGSVTFLESYSSSPIISYADISQ
jgi:hypothetical protein